MRAKTGVMTSGVIHRNINIKTDILLKKLYKVKYIYALTNKFIVGHFLSSELPAFFMPLIQQDSRNHFDMKASSRLRFRAQVAYNGQTN